MPIYFNRLQEASLLCYTVHEDAVPSAKLCRNCVFYFTCILGRMCFVERSIRLIEEQCIILDRSSGFRSFHRILFHLFQLLIALLLLLSLLLSIYPPT